MATVITKDSRSSYATDTLKNFRFVVAIQKQTADGRQLSQLGFSGVSGIALVNSVVALQQGGLNVTTTKQPGQSDSGPVTLSHGVALNAPQMWDWYREVQGAAQGQPIAGTTNFKAPVDIYSLAHPWTKNNQVPILWAARLYNAWPSTFQLATPLDAMGSDVMVEQLILANEGIDVRYAADFTGVTLW